MSRPIADSSASPETYTNPVRLSVTTRESGPVNRNAEAGPSQKQPERERLLKARKANELIRRKGEKWADKLMEETVDKETFKRALRYIPPSAYSEITHERHLNSKCSYPLCPNPPFSPYNPNRRFRISTTNRSITEVEGNKEDGYCGKGCRVKSEWVGRKLSEGGSVLARGKGWEMELVEDLGLNLEKVAEEARGVDSPSLRRDVRVTTSRNLVSPARSIGSSPSTMSAKAGGTPSTSRSASTTSPLMSKEGLEPSPDPALSAPPASPIPPTDLLSNLQIHERPTPSSVSEIPPPPSLSAAIPSSVTTQSPSPKANATGDPQRTKRAPTSILGEQSKLAQTVLKASKGINPQPQINPDSESEGEHEEVEWEREVGLTWEGEAEGEGDGGDLWEDMRAAREMVDEE